MVAHLVSGRVVLQIQDRLLYLYKEGVCYCEMSFVKDRAKSTLRYTVALHLPSAAGS